MKITFCELNQQKYTQKESLKYPRKFEVLHEKPEFSFSPEKMPLTLNAKNLKILNGKILGNPDLGLCDRFGLFTAHFQSLRLSLEKSIHKVL